MISKEYLIEVLIVSTIIASHIDHFKQETKPQPREIQRTRILAFNLVISSH